MNSLRSRQKYPSRFWSRDKKIKDLQGTGNRKSISHIMDNRLKGQCRLSNLHQVNCLLSNWAKWLHLQGRQCYHREESERKLTLKSGNQIYLQDSQMKDWNPSWLASMILMLDLTMSHSLSRQWSPRRLKTWKRWHLSRTRWGTRWLNRIPSRLASVLSIDCHQWLMARPHPKSPQHYPSVM